MINRHFILIITFFKPKIPIYLSTSKLLSQEGVYMCLAINHIILPPSNLLIIIMSVQLQKIEGLIKQRLFQKYSQAFHFYQVKPVNEILNGEYDSPTCIQLNDIRALIDDTEFLRRLYFYRTLTGRSEIDHRIKLCADYYSKIIPIAHHYPMMIITNTRSLFIKRNRRLKKIQAGEGSSDETEQAGEPFVDFNEPSSCDFLDDLENSSLEEDAGESSSESAYDSSQHDLFEADASDSNSPQQHLPLILKEIDEGSLSHLITDLTQKMDKEDGQSTSPCLSKPALTILDNKPFSENSISVTAISSQKLQLEKRKSNASKYFELLHDNRGLILSGLISGFQNSVASEEVKKIPSMQEERPQKAELESRRKRIRQKAEELLRRAKNDMEEGNILRE